MTHNTYSVVDQATAKFPQLEMPARAQQEFAQQIIAAAKQEFENVKMVIDGTADSPHQTVAAVLQRLSVFVHQVKHFQNMDHSAAMKSLNTTLIHWSRSGSDCVGGKRVSVRKVDTAEDL